MSGNLPANLGKARQALQQQAFQQQQAQALLQQQQQLLQRAQAMQATQHHQQFQEKLPMQHANSQQSNPGQPAQSEGTGEPAASIVNRTISRNETGGNLIKEEALLRTALTAKNRSGRDENANKGIPDPAMGDGATQSRLMKQQGFDQTTGELYPPRTPMPQNSTTVAAGAQQVNNGKHALQDFQMDLMLLEQQNKKRLLMARQEQDRMVHPMGAPSGRPTSSQSATSCVSNNVQSQGGTKASNRDIAGFSSPTSGMLNPSAVQLPIRTMSEPRRVRQSSPVGQKSRDTRCEQQQSIMVAMGLLKEICDKLLNLESDHLDQMLSTITSQHLEEGPMAVTDLSSSPAQHHQPPRTRQIENDARSLPGAAHNDFEHTVHDMDDRALSMGVSMPDRDRIAQAAPSDAQSLRTANDTEYESANVRYRTTEAGAEKFSDMNAIPMLENSASSQVESINKHNVDELCRFETRDTPTPSNGKLPIRNYDLSNLQKELAKVKTENAVLHLALGHPSKFEDWPTLHRVHCPHTEDHTTYAEKPLLLKYKSEDHLHLGGQRRIVDELDWEARAEDIPFVVYLDYNCPNDGRDNESRRGNRVRKSDIAAAEKSAEPYQEEVHILSNTLLATLEGIFDGDTALKAYNQAGMRDHSVMMAPYLFFFHFESVFQSFASSLDEIEAEDLDLLIKYLQQNTKTSTSLVEETLHAGFVTADIMPYLFAPGNLLITTYGQDLPYVVLRQKSILRGAKAETKSFDGDYWPNNSKNGEMKWDFRATGIEFDGNFRERDIGLKLSLEANERVAITSLPVYPLQYAKDVVRESLIMRGKTFYSCKDGRYVEAQTDNGSAHPGTAIRYMVDVQAFRTMHESESTTIWATKAMPSWMSLWDEDSSRTLIHDAPDDEEFLLQLPGFIQAYHMEEKRWIKIKVDEIADNVEWNKEAFENLVIESDTKEIIEALVKNKIASDKSIDFVQGKGTGLIILLHGGPGTGKTLTAESVAEIAEKPLYRVTCGDVGIDPQKVEEYLESVFYLGRRWKSVVLLDEADVFLQQRDLDNLARNSLVSVFLRTLEYYDGILILTSNRVGGFDEAFKSRIQLALYYPNLKAEQRAQIWKNFINRLATFEDMVDTEELHKHVPELAEFELNGRQIRNSINNARGLAMSKDERMNYKHLERVIRVGQRFEDYLVKMRGAKDDDFMLDQGLRL